MKTQEQIFRANKRAQDSLNFRMDIMLFTKNGLLKNKVSEAISNMRIDDNKLYCGSYSGSGRFTRRRYTGHYITRLLDLAGAKYTEGNDP
jgi:hypothetical protein